MFDLADIFSPDIIEFAQFPALDNTPRRCVPAKISVDVGVFPEAVVNQSSTFLRCATVDYSTLPVVGDIVIYRSERLRVVAVDLPTYRDTFRLALGKEFDRG
jgi:hypothetical protein